MSQSTKNPLDINSVSTCKVCAHLGDRHVASYGDPSARLLILGGSPSEAQARSGDFLAGPAGDLLELGLDVAGLDKEEVYFTLAVKCKPIGSRKSSPAERRNCMYTWLNKELKNVNPECILVLGKEAAQSLFGDDVEFTHLKLIETPTKRKVLISNPLEWFLRNGDVEGFIEVGEKLYELLQE